MDESITISIMIISSTCGPALGRTQGPGPRPRPRRSGLLAQQILRHAGDGAGGGGPIPRAPHACDAHQRRRAQLARMLTQQLPARRNTGAHWI